MQQNIGKRKKYDRESFHTIENKGSSQSTKLTNSIGITIRALTTEPASVYPEKTQQS